MGKQRPSSAVFTHRAARRRARRVERQRLDYVASDPTSDETNVLARASEIVDLSVFQCPFNVRSMLT